MDGNTNYTAMKTKNTKAFSKEEAIAAAKKMLSDKQEWLDCVRNNRPLSTLKDKGIVLSKLG